MTSDKATEKGSGRAGRVASNGSDSPDANAAASDPNDPLFSLSVDDGAGALLAAAAGDVAGGADSTSYSAITQAATVLAYHLLTHGSVDRDVLARGLVELAGGEDGRFTYRAPSAAFDDWLRSSLRGNPTVSSMGASEPAARSVPIGVSHPRDPHLLVASAANASRVSRRFPCSRGRRSRRCGRGIVLRPGRG